MNRTFYVQKFAPLRLSIGAVIIKNLPWKIFNNFSSARDLVNVHKLRLTDRQHKYQAVRKCHYLM